MDGASVSDGRPHRSDPANRAYEIAFLCLRESANDLCGEDGEGAPLPLVATPSLVRLCSQLANRGGVGFRVKSKFLSTAVSRLEAAPYDASLIDESERRVVAVLTETVLLPGSVNGGGAYATASSAHSAVADLGAAVPFGRVCQRPFRKNDIAWGCRTCQADATCVICNECFEASDHVGHDVLFMQAVEGGCCDCGDVDAWNPAGFCERHGSNAAMDEDAVGRLLGEGVLESARGVLEAAAEWLAEVVAEGVVNSFGWVEVAAPDPGRWLGDDFQRRRGLYLVLHSDSVHGAPEIDAALRELYSDLMPTPPADVFERIVQILESNGDVVVWDDLTAKLGGQAIPSSVMQQRHLDEATADHTVQTMLARARLLGTKHGLVVSVKTGEDLLTERRAVAVLRWLSTVAQSCDPLCDAVAEKLMDRGRLVPMLRAGLKLPRPIAEAWHSLLLKLLAVPSFKDGLADAYCDTHQALQLEYARGVGVADRSPFAFSVQFLNRERYAKRLVQERNIQRILGSSLLGALKVAVLRSHASLRGSDLSLPVLDPNHPVLEYQTYNPSLADLTYLLNVRGIARIVVASRPADVSPPGNSFLEIWMESLSLGQNMDPQVWRRRGRGHIETDPTGYYGAFNFSVGLSRLFSLLLNWDDGDPMQMNKSGCEDVDGVAPLPPFMSSEELTCYVTTTGLWSWLEPVMRSYRAAPSDVSDASPHSRAPAALPMSTIASRRGTPLSMEALPIAQTFPWSFHLPLHRFVAACLRKVAEQPCASSIDSLLQRMNEAGDEVQIKLMQRGLMEFPVIVLSRTAEIRSGLWRRNGPVMDQQAELYASAPYCPNFRDADLILIQFSLLWNYSLDGKTASIDSAGCALTINLLLHRFGLFDFLGFEKAPDTDVSLYRNEGSSGLYPTEQDGRLPSTYTPAKDTASFLSLLDELLHLLIILFTELPPPPPRDRIEKVKQAKLRLRRELVHQLASGPKTHSELETVYQVMAPSDCSVLSEEGEVLNLDNAAGAMLEEALSHIATSKSSRARGGGDAWEMTREAWAEYDPAFYHLGVEGHQSAAENRPVGKCSSSLSKKILAQPYTPLPPSTHRSFLRIRRDITSDASVLALAYRTLHVHCRRANSKRITSDLRGKSAYEDMATRETVLARVIHLLTLGAYAWDDGYASDDESTFCSWETQGGGGKGSVFHNFKEKPTRRDWIQMALLSNPRDIMKCNWYEGEEKAIELLQRLALKGGCADVFVVQDSSIQAGATWICDYAAKSNPEAANILGLDSNARKQRTEGGATGESAKQRKMNEARERALARIKAQTDKFNATVFGDANLGDDNPEITPSQTDSLSTGKKIQGNTFIQVGNEVTGESDVQRKKREAKERALAKINAQAKLFDDMLSSEEGNSGGKLVASGVGTGRCGKEESRENDELLEESLQCIICSQGSEKDVGAISFCAHAQASTVMKGGGGLPPGSPPDHVSAFRCFVGTHVTLCGHAVHNSCLQSDLKKTSAQRDDLLTNEFGEKSIGEFRCPLCRRLSNCLVINVARDEVGAPAGKKKIRSGDCQKRDAYNLGTQGLKEHESNTPTLHNFLFHTKWWGSRNDDSVSWDDRCKFVKSSSADRSGSTDVAEVPSSSFDNSNHRTEQRADRQQLMDHISDVSYQGDVKRLGEERLRCDLGEFRQVEMEAFSAENGKAGRKMSDTENAEQDLLREKELSKLFGSIQAFAYSCCSDGHEARYALKKSSAALDAAAMKQLHSKHGIGSVACDGQLLLFPPSTGRSDNLFDGRLGKLRRLGLALVMGTCTFSREIVQLALSFPFFPNSKMDHASSDSTRANWAPITYPLLRGHVLTHVVAAMCAACGQVQGHCDLKDKERKHGSFCPLPVDNDKFSVCLSFIKLGFIARVLQVMLGSVGLHAKEPGQQQQTEQNIFELLESVGQFLDGNVHIHNEDTMWHRCCCLLVKSAISASNRQSDGSIAVEMATMPSIFRDACSAAMRAGVSFLADSGLILQVLLPDATARLRQTDEATNTNLLESLMSRLGIEPILEMLESPLVCEVISSWYVMSGPFRRASEESRNRCNSLDCEWPYPILDWPFVEQSEAIPDSVYSQEKVKSVPLLGGKLCPSSTSMTGRQACVQMLPTSYTNLYAQVCALCPDFEETALCLVCGDLLDASGKGECTKHAYKCGGGAGIFFLLQERTALILHSRKAAFEPSPYVDNHGETPKHGGRPLFLDFVRYDGLRGLWFGHLVREKVISERGNLAEGLIKDNFY